MKPTLTFAPRLQIAHHSEINLEKMGPLIQMKLLTFLALKCSLRVAVPTPRGKTGGRERLRKTETNRLLCLEYGI